MRLEDFRALLTPAGQMLLADLPAYDETSALAVQTRLRRDHPPELVAAALTQARLRARAEAKFGDRAARMYFTPDGLEQATRATVARRRAARFASPGVRTVADLCAGIGGDALALAEAGLDVIAVDRDPLACAVLEANSRALGLSHRIRVRTADVTSYDVTGCDAAFFDPARRDGGGRTFDPGSYSPPFGFVEDLLLRMPDLGVKVAPGIPHHRIPQAFEAEWVSDGGDVKEAALWSGRLRTGATRRATLLPSGATVRDEAVAAIPVRAPGGWLYEPDGAVIRAHLVAEIASRVNGWLIDASIAYVSADRLVPSPFATAYQVLDVMPFQLKRLRAALRALDVGSLTIKKRGSALDPETLRAMLRLTGKRSATIVVTRAKGAPVVLFVAPADQD